MSLHQNYPVAFKRKCRVWSPIQDRDSGQFLGPLLVRTKDSTPVISRISKVPGPSTHSLFLPCQSCFSIPYHSLSSSPSPPPFSYLSFSFPSPPPPSSSSSHSFSLLSPGTEPGLWFSTTRSALEIPQEELFKYLKEDHPT